MAGKSSKEPRTDLAPLDSDIHFAFIAGYTDGGFPYGVTWEELKNIETQAARARTPGLSSAQKNPISLNAVVEQMDLSFDEMTTYFKRSTGEFISVNEEGQSLDNWIDEQAEAIRDAAELLINANNGDYIPLPSTFDINEYAIIERFCHMVEKQKIRNDLLGSISGKGAFRRFKNALYQHAIEADWYQYKAEAFKEIAREWCKSNAITWSEDTT